GGDPLLAVEEEAVHPDPARPLDGVDRLPLGLVRREVQIRHGPLLLLPPAIEVEVGGHVFEATVKELEDVVDSDVPQLAEIGFGYPLEIRSKGLLLLFQLHAPK